MRGGCAGRTSFGGPRATHTQPRRNSFPRRRCTCVCRSCCVGTHFHQFWSDRALWFLYEFWYSEGHNNEEPTIATRASVNTGVREVECACNFVLRVPAERDAEAWARKGDVDVHAVDSDLRAVLRSKVGVLLNVKPKVPHAREFRAQSSRSLTSCTFWRFPHSSEHRTITRHAICSFGFCSRPRAGQA